MTWFSRATFVLFTGMFGGLAVRDYHRPRARRILRSVLEENMIDPEDIPDRTYDLLMAEAFDRAQIQDPKGVLRWGKMVSVVIEIGEAVVAFNKGENSDKRVDDILGAAEPRQ